MSFISTFKYHTPEREKLEAAAKMLTVFSPKKFTYYVDETYFDYGQDWKWTTILCEGNDYGSCINTWQALSPRQQENIIMADTPNAMADAVMGVFNGDFCVDKL